METDNTSRRNALLGVLVACASALALFCPAAHAAEEPTDLAFNPVLSVTGDCTTSELDPIPDPGCPGGNHPPSRITNPTAIATDSYGDVYVGSTDPTLTTTPDKGEIDIFNARGEYLSQLVLDLNPRSMAVDSEGNLYVSGYSTKGYLRRYNPASYDPAAGVVSYSATPTYIDERSNGSVRGLAVNPNNDHLFVNLYQAGNSGEAFIAEYGSAAEGNPLLDPEVAPVSGSDGTAMAIDAAHGRIYVNKDIGFGGCCFGPQAIEVFQLAPPHNLIKVIDGSTLPDEKFVDAYLYAGVDESTGHLFVYAPEVAHSIFELSAEGEYLATITHKFSGRYRGIAVDNGVHSPNGALNPDGRTIWVSSATGLGAEGHAFAFGPSTECAPTVESTSTDHVGETEVLLSAAVEPCELETNYRFEYVTENQFSQNGFADAKLAAEGTISAGASPVAVSTGVKGLTPGTGYRWRIVATNSLGTDESGGQFKTYPSAPSGSSCPNETLRVGLSALLPDCRSYELVTPPDTNGLTPDRLTLGSFPTVPVSLAGGKVFFTIPGGLIPGSDGTGSLIGDPYVASRGPEGWSTENVGGSGTEATTVTGGSRSTDLSHFIWFAEGEGPAVIKEGSRAPKPRTTWVRFPDGHSELLAQGDLGTDPEPEEKFISPGGTHMIFDSIVRLMEEVPPGSGQQVYDRTDNGVTHVASVLPDGTFPNQARYLGATPDGKAIAFAVEGGSGPELYLRYNEKETFLIPSGSSFAYVGISADGKRVFYLENGNLYAYDIGAGVIPFATSGDTTVVNVGRDGTAAYFLSPSRLTSAPNPAGQTAKAGNENLYLSREGAISYVATVTERDVFNAPETEGLGTWVKGLPSRDPSRTTADGSVIVFESRADLTGEESAGNPQIYRYGSVTPELRCISCNPTGLPGGLGAALESGGEEGGVANNGSELVENLASDGRRVFFGSTERLVGADTDGLRDVYEWEADGKGTCAETGGCLALISSGASAANDYLWGVSESGQDVFIRTGDRLTSNDPDETPSIYDARVDGGFPVTTSPAECLGEACQPAAVPPERPAQVLHGAGNVPRPSLHCPKGRRAVHKGRRRRRRCVTRRHHTKHRRKHRHSAKGTNHRRGQR